MIKDDTYCVMPFLSLAVKPDGKVKPCCRYKTWTDNDKREWYDNSDINHNIVGSNAAPVSYTHLTLPTIYSV